MGLRDEHRHRIFVSVDVVGSTQHKASSEYHEWIAEFESFFEDVPTEINASIMEARDGRLRAVELTVWKYAGDEVLFVAELLSPEDGLTVVRGLRAFLMTPRDRKKLSLPLKGTAWTAEFGDRNRELTPGGSDAGGVRDYIGPCIDRGFRLSGLSNVDRFVMCPELALMCVDTIIEREIADSFLPILYEGDRALKGVADGAPFPVLSSPLRSSISKKDELLGRRFSHSPREIRELLDEFFRDVPAVRAPCFVNHQHERYRLSDARIRNYDDAVNTRSKPPTDGQPGPPATDAAKRSLKNPELRKE